MDTPKILLIKKLPADLNPDETTDLLRYFGAVSVSCMSSMGNMKGCAFAEFNNSEEASLAMSRLHQAKLFNKRLIVEYSEKEYMPVEPPDPIKVPEQDITPAVTNVTSHEPDPSLHYLYPPPTPLTLNNISHALVAIPQFYVQVLHLMNKINLPPPFGAPTNQTVEEPPPLPSSEESELESDNEDKVPKPEVTRLLQTKRATVDRKRKRIVSSEPCERKDKHLANTVRSRPSVQDHLSQVEVTEPNTARSSLHDGATAPSEPIPVVVKPSEVVPVVVVEPPEVVPVVVLEPSQVVPVAVIVVEPSSDPRPDPLSQFESHRKKMSENIMSKDQLEQSAVFRKYSPGVPSSKLYLKNLHKNTTSEELTKLFEIYTKQELCQGYEFSIKLMKEGRMKGQAFITFPSVVSAGLALNDLHGYILHEKPIAIQYGKTNN